MIKNIVWLLLASLCILLFWVFLTPPFEFPDEQSHFTSVNFLVEEGRMPKGKEYDLTKEIIVLEKALGTFRDSLGNNKYTYHPEYRIHYTNNVFGSKEKEIINLKDKSKLSIYLGKEGARYPPFYYYYLSFPYSLFKHDSIFMRIFVLRIFTILLIVGIYYFGYLIGIELFNDKTQAETLSLLLIFHPMLSFVGAGINSDNLHNLFFTIIIYLSIHLIKNPKLSFRKMMFLTLVGFADIFTKPQGYTTLPIVFLALTLRLVYQRPKFKFRFPSLTFLLFFTFVFFIVKKFILALKVFIFVPNLKNVSFAQHLQFSINKLITQNIIWYWGVFKWLGVVLPKPFWWLANRLIIISGVGIIIYLIRSLTRKKLNSRFYIVIFLIIVTCFYIFAIFLADWSHTKKVGYSLGVQARYYFPTISAHLALLLFGFTSLGWNKRVGEWLRKVLVIFFISLHLAGLYTLASSYYDLWPLSTFITQASQYKPFFAKGAWWYLWGGLYLVSLIYLSLKTLFQPTGSDPVGTQ